MDFKGFDKNFNIDGKTAVITGGASGIGNAIASLYVEKGGNVALLDIKDNVNEEAKKLDSERAIGIQCNIMENESIDHAFNEVRSRFGTVDILINSAGVALLDDAENLSDDYWQTTIDLNLTASFKMCQKAGNVMIEQGQGGKIINIASQAALIALDNHVAYSASKAGIVSITKSLAYEWASFNINVNAISPTVILTELGKKAWSGEKGEKAKKEIPLGRFGYPEEVAAIALFLASDATDLITGENIVIDGGNTIK
ncbi:GolD/DthD family dehydrogenase [Halobacillus sp. A5]|uniref:GolD/DthD family dehydrogenase n=1 Tax=Halobacillus sp. A5 TaxID=2880263 RepID=UPI0020A6AE7E|nr:D-threitol dehydrogenase [Halobacillus sp. A5]